MNHVGLTTKEAVESKHRNGSNALTQQERESFLVKLKGNFDDPIIKILCAALFINVIFAILGQVKWYESVGIGLAVVLATVVSTFSEFKNETAFKKLQEEASQIYCKVYRDGTVQEILIDEIVVGDSVILQAGDKIPADGIVVDGELHVDQSVLNGETKECTKTASSPYDIAASESTDLLNPYKVFRGAVVSNGHAVFHVTTVGDSTLYGEIAAELQSSDDRDTPLKLKLSVLAEQISKFGYIGGVLIAFAFLFQRIVFQNSFDLVLIMNYCANLLQIGNDIVEAVMLAVIIIVMAVPEGLPLMIAIVSAQNMGKMLKDNVLVRKVSGIETAGSINILFSDKTGTITKGKLEMTSFIDGNGTSYTAFTDLSEYLQTALRHQAIYNTNSIVSNDGKVVGGNATERSFFSFVPAALPEENLRVTETIPFNSKNKFSVVHIEENSTPYNLVKGEPTSILNACNTMLAPDGTTCSFQPEAVEEMLASLSRNATRVLALAVYDGKMIKEGSEKMLPSNMCFIGAIGIRDELREESKAAIREVQVAGIQVVMITGDSYETAEAIAREAGIITKDRNLILHSSDLKTMNDAVLRQKLPHLAAIARALPSDKSRLVKLAQKMNLVVGMTGDGVNDSPALKTSDVGFAMGGGTEVAKEASEIVILDDNFSSIAKAILYGRTIFNSIRKFIVFQLTINVSAVAISFICPLLGIENPLTIVQILWVNLVMDTLAALAFGGEPALSRFMNEAPKKRDEKIISPNMLVSISCGSVITFIISMHFLLGSVAQYFPSDASHLTGYFTLFILISVFNAFCCRTDELNLFSHIKENKGFLPVMAIIVIVQIVMTELGGDILRCYGLNISQWGYILYNAFLIVPILLIVRLLNRFAFHTP